MPIQVTCPGCKATFSVSDKFAGKQGPCPKCKSLITIPKPQAEVTIHAPAVDAPQAKLSQAGRNLTPKPIRRQETTITVKRGVVIGAIVVASIAGAFFGGPFMRENDNVSLAIRVLAIFAVSVPICAGAYAILREDELEPFRGRSLILRCLVCGAVYTILWVAFHFVPPGVTRSVYMYALVAPPFFLVGAGVALASFDLDFGNGFFHYAAFVLLTVALGYVAGVPMPWASLTT